MEKQYIFEKFKSKILRNFTIVFIFFAKYLGARIYKMGKYLSLYFQDMFTLALVYHDPY